MIEYITSDQHFWHKNIIKFQKDVGSRPFTDVRHMNAELIERHNSVVGVDDEVLYGGDFAFANVNQTIDILEQLNGIKHYVYGNHDKQMYHPKVKAYFETMSNYKEIMVDGTRIVICHYPIFSWNREMHGAIHLYGHTHNNIPFVEEGYSMDIGCDANMCYPFKISDILDDMSEFRKINNLPKGRDARSRPEVR
jgi:calcineurin-like phosphoesterase family protein